MRAEDVFFVTGTDEHGSKILQAAERAKADPQAFVNKYSARFRLLADTLNISNDDFVRTTEPRHVVASQELGAAPSCREKYTKKNYVGLYCIGCEALRLTKNLVDGKCPDHNTIPELLEEENYFFKLTDYKDALLKLFAFRPDFVVPNGRFNEVKEWVKDLEDSASRDRRASSLGAFPCRRSGSGHVCLVRRAYQLPHRHRLFPTNVTRNIGRRIRT